MSFSELIQKHILSPTGRLLVLGEEGADPIAKIVPNLTYTFKDRIPDLVHTVDFIRTSTCFDLLRIGKGLEPTGIFDYFYGLISEGGLIVVDHPEFRPRPTLGITELIYEDEFRVVFRREPVEQKIKFAIVIATYHRKAGNSKTFVERALKSIKNQTYQNFKVFLIGDKYEQEDEFNRFKELLPSDQIETVNLPVAWEREHCQDRYSLWCVGGANAMNYGMNLAVEQGFTHYVHLDDDDYWHPFHLRNVAMGYTQFPEASFVCTMGATNDLWILPTCSGLGYNNFKCQLKGAFHSSYGFRLDLHPLRYITYVPGQPVPKIFADGEMLNRIGQRCEEFKMKFLALPLLTCLHDFEAAPDTKIAAGPHLILDLASEGKRSRSEQILRSRYHFIYDLRTLLGPEKKKYRGSELGSILTNHSYQTEESKGLVDLLLLEEPSQKIEVLPGGFIVTDDLRPELLTPNYEVYSMPNGVWLLKKK